MRELLNNLVRFINYDEPIDKEMLEMLLRKPPVQKRKSNLPQVRKGAV